MTDEEFSSAVDDVIRQAADQGIAPEVVLAMLIACFAGQSILAREGVELHSDQASVIWDWASGLIDEATMVQRCREVVS